MNKNNMRAKNVNNMANFIPIIWKCRWNGYFFTKMDLSFKQAPHPDDFTDKFFKT